MTHVLIAGGGIAGAVTAMSLHRAGISSTVYEAYPSGADDVGAFLVLFHNGLEALRTIGAHQPVLDVSFPAERIETLSHTGDSLGTRPVSGGEAAEGAEGAAGGRKLLGPRTLRRATLYRALHDEAARRGITIEHGKRLVAAETTEDGRVRARFGDGTAAEGDLLVGADGLHSMTRSLIDPDAPSPRHTGQITVCGWAAGMPPEAAPAQGTYRMIQGRRAFLGCTTAPDGEVWWFANTPGPELSKDRLATDTPERNARWREHVAALFAEDASPAADIVRATGDGIFTSNAYDVARTPVWSRGPMVVLGDAAHAAAPNAAQGASMAIEDSVVLAKCLRDLPSPGEAFAAYEELRRERVEAVVERSARINDRAVPSAARGRGNNRPQSADGSAGAVGSPGDEGSASADGSPGAEGSVGAEGSAGAGGSAAAESLAPSRKTEGVRVPEGADWLLHYRIDWDTPVASASASTPTATGS
ncbi:FAD-dependent monooxygenase [Streptomyces iconiensis]|uniref:FAD-dependent monooxygenase n=1 Tax=Streptomyces iconiensis TaxID=1384038 RepID=A0ABT6ZV69_9ACTN|nr:FAD-dependent monooxygenase [Streptomyces iconiensis]MDJ1132960.1 FAD-dependent monooxygenase [Streptomyces iconiensis]